MLVVCNVKEGDVIVYSTTVRCPVVVGRSPVHRPQNTQYLTRTRPYNKHVTLSNFQQSNLYVVKKPFFNKPCLQWIYRKSRSFEIC